MRKLLTTALIASIIILLTGCGREEDNGHRAQGVVGVEETTDQPNSSPSGIPTGEGSSNTQDYETNEKRERVDAMYLSSPHCPCAQRHLVFLSDSYS